jgi:uncharacterized cupin superfamily protein
MPKLVIPPLTREDDTGHPVLGSGLGAYSHASLGDLAGLTQFGAQLEVLHPGARSSHRHWHAAEDELVYVLSGVLVLVEDNETMLEAGDVAAWPKGLAVGHCLENRSDADARYLVVGSRSMADVVHYPDAGVSVTVTDRTHRVFRDRQGVVVAEYATAPADGL